MNFGTVIRIYSLEWRWVHSNLSFAHELGQWRGSKFTSKRRYGRTSGLGAGASLITIT